MGLADLLLCCILSGRLVCFAYLMRSFVFRPPTVSGTYHEKMVYGVSWGPVCHTHHEGMFNHDLYRKKIFARVLLIHGTGHVIMYKYTITENTDI